MTNRLMDSNQTEKTEFYIMKNLNASGQYELSKREYFAILIMQGIITHRGNEVDFMNPETDPNFPELALVWAQDAVAAADALLEVLNWVQGAHD